MRKLIVLLVVLLIPTFVGAYPSSQASTPLPEPKAGGPVPSWCTNRNDSWCTYGWNWMTRCCYPTYISPGAYCPTICE
jgi:hypothetical protein